MQRDTQVRKENERETYETAGDSERTPRAVLPAAVPVAADHRFVANDPLGEPLSIREVAEMLGCSAWTVRQRYLPRGLPHFRMGPTGKLVFYRKQVTRWILDQQERGNGRR
jgi:hypothetical protein